MNSRDIPRYEQDEVGEYRLVCRSCAEPIEGGTICAACAALCVPPPGCSEDCSRCVVEVEEAA